MMNLGRIRILGRYILIACILQVVLYFALALWKEGFDWLIYLDPRLGLFYFESGFRGKEEVAPTIVRWLSAAWILTLAVLLVSGRSLIKTYIVSEVVLSIPNLLFVLAIISANLSAAPSDVQDAGFKFSFAHRVHADC